MHLPTSQWNEADRLEKAGVKKGGQGRKLSLAILKLSKGGIFITSPGLNFFAAKSESSGNTLYCNTRQPYSQHCWNVFKSPQFYESHAINLEKLHMLDQGHVKAKKEAQTDIPGKTGISLCLYLLSNESQTEMQGCNIKYNKCFFGVIS